MDNLIKQLKEFETSIVNIYNAADLHWSELNLAIKRASELIAQIKLSSKTNKNLQLQTFMASILASLQMLQEFAIQSQANAVDSAAKPILTSNTEAEMPGMKKIMQYLSKTYHDHLEPMIREIGNKKDSEHLGVSLEQANMFATLGNNVLNCTNDIVMFRENMNRQEKICATLGVIMMFAGLGLLLAAMINPATAPIVVPLVIISLGCYLCRKSVQRHKLENNPAAVNIDKNLDKAAESVDKITTELKQVNPARKYLFFSEGPTSDSSFAFMDTIINRFKQLFTPQK